LVFTAKNPVGSREINKDFTGMGRRHLFYVDIDG
jgi:hypothetical protein